ncbi:MAG: hypothetical protein ACE5G0_10755 [Rhodothermales bacterium]
MNSNRFSLCWMGMVLLAVFFLAPTAAAQEEAEADTIYVDEGTIVIKVDDDGRRIIINGVAIDDLDGKHVFRFGSGKDAYSVAFGDYLRHRPRIGVRMPKLERFFDDEFNAFAVAPDPEGHGVVIDQLRDLEFRLGGSMKERSEISKMEMETRRLARQARRAEGEERARLEQELEEKLNEIFDRKQALREQHIEKLREQMNEALDKNNERQQNKSEIVERRLRELLGKEDKYDW